MAPRKSNKQSQQIEEGMGASDSNSGGGSGAGIPDAEMQMRTGGAYSGRDSDVERDREKLFPEYAEKKKKLHQPAPVAPHRHTRGQNARTRGSKGWVRHFNPNK